jgi:CO/xanthine dehydrogenase Mo-binding subunit
MKDAGRKIFQSQNVVLKDGAIVEPDLNRKMGYREVAFTEGNHDLKASYILQNVDKPHGCSAGAVARISFHPLTGELRVESVKVVLDAGPVLYQKGLEIQVESAISWAMAALFSSELENDQPIPTTLDGPEESMLTTLEYPVKDLAEKPLEYFGSRGISDVIMSVVLGSLVNAIFEAKSVSLESIPMSLEFMYPKRKQQTVLTFPLKRF